MAKHRHRFSDFGMLVICNCGEAYWLDHPVHLEEVVRVGMTTGRTELPKGHDKHPKE